MTTKSPDEHSTDNQQEAPTQPHNGRADVIQWQCMNCGQYIFVIVDTEPPDTCEYCQDMTTWQCVDR